MNVIVMCHDVIILIYFTAGKRQPRKVVIVSHYAGAAAIKGCVGYLKGKCFYCRGILEWVNEEGA